MAKPKRKIRADTTNIKKRESYMSYFLQHDDLLLPDGYKPLEKNSSIQKCANIKADMVSSMTIMLMENGANGDVRIKNELSRKMDVNPCSYMNRKNFIFKIAKEMVLDGNSFVHPIVDNGYLSDMIPLERDYIVMTGDTFGYKVNYRGITYSPDELLHFSLIPSLREPWRGVGYRDAIVDSVVTLVQAEATKKGFMQSKWKPSMIISIQSDVEELQDPETRRKILGSYQADTEAGEPWLIPAGEIDVKTIQPLTLKSLAIQESIELDIKTIACGMRIPPFMVGVGSFDKDEFNNFISTDIMSMAMIIQQELTNKTLINRNWYWKMNQKSLMQYALADKYAFVHGMVSDGAMNRNEERAEFDYSPVDEPGMNEYNVLENFIPVSEIGNQKKLNGGNKDE